MRTMTLLMSLKFRASFTKSVEYYLVDGAEIFRLLIFDPFLVNFFGSIHLFIHFKVFGSQWDFRVPKRYQNRPDCVFCICNNEDDQHF